MDESDFEARLESGGQGGEPARVVLVGELDVSTAETVSSLLREIDRSASGLVLDMAGVSFIDSSGLRMLIQARQMFDEREDAVTIRSPQQTTIRLLELTGLAEHFVID